jgi:single-stranded-DNA-specific exonuclease
MSTTSLQTRTRRKRWIEPPDIAPLGERLHDHPLIDRLLSLRGLKSASEASRFLDHTDASLPDPFLLRDMDRAVHRISRAVGHGERIAVFGDYDVDGITSTAILWSALTKVVPDMAKVMRRLPTRSEGYGLNSVSLDEMAEAGVTVLIALDCASSDDEGVAYARSLGMDVVIVDHHTMHHDGPDGAITVSPQRDREGLYREISASGLTSLLVAALETDPMLASRGIAGSAAETIDLAALGIVADVSPMIGANRLLVREGLRALRQNPRLGVRVLCESAGIDWTTMNTMRIGFTLGPRLNAAGRLADPLPALELLLAEDEATARALAGQLESLNIQRQRETNRILENVIERVEADTGFASRHVVVESAPHWLPGVVGLAAGKLAEALGRPVVLLTEQGETAVGSARSVKGFSIIDAMNRHPDLFLRKGGHRSAAGMTMRTELVPRLREALEREVVASGVLVPVEDHLQLDADLQQHDLSLDTARMIARLSPFGEGNPEPVLRLRDVPIVRTETMGRDRSHLRLVWRAGSGQEIKAPFFSAAHRAREIQPARRYDVACTLSFSYWKGPRLDVKVLDFRESGT